MNYNAVAFAVMLSGVAVFYLLLSLAPRLTFEHFLVLGAVEAVAVLIFVYAHFETRYNNLEKRLRELEREKTNK